ncbi:serine/threonine protein phosphatase Azr1 [Schizosaccharomyces japonicus yFS275]|uniref:Protein phosphatase n=1 Tax=Schizosaccharomyces japonicus (strain yFS275 / FY16936) TaxID=402676 RepID=B6JYL1_SCHJY|nr:serine/threonine protein phosphatase Azr1 [Schizosaccharomyces japonicus yFS275]EEB06629.1 serine/threonine protein phosphatase Azr1 [Schizosaccharomyces japonicus yFS275]
MSKFHSFGHITNNVLNIKRFFTHNSKNIPVYLSASFQKKNTKVSTPVTLEHPDSGEDAFLCVKKPNYSLAAVFDGVGGWASKGIDPSKFSWGLCKQLEQLVSSKQSLMKNPTELLTSAFNALKKSKTVVAGSSTACIATYEEETCKLRTLNLGDSGYMLIRNGLVEYISPPQTVQFNTPFQLSIYPTAQPYEDPMQPRVGQKNTHNILQNDVVIVATDGLFDNMEAEDCANIVRQLISSPSQDPQSLADKIVKTICQQAVSNSRDEVWLSPFARAAQTVGYRYTGGKVDDTTVLCMLFQ